MVSPLDERPTKGRVLVGATGAISIVDLPQYLAALRGITAELTVVLTPTASRMLPSSTLRYLCRVFDDQSAPSHVALARAADLLVVLPCTAHTLGCLAHGLAPNLLTSTALAHADPLLVFPVMNESMWQKPSVQRNVSRLRGDGHSVIEPTVSPVYEVASGTTKVGLGLPSPDEVCQLVVTQLADRSARDGLVPERIPAHGPVAQDLPTQRVETAEQPETSERDR